MEEIFGILFEKFGTLAWWYALAEVIASWLGLILTIVVIVIFIKVLVSEIF